MDIYINKSITYIIDIKIIIKIMNIKWDSLMHEGKIKAPYNFKAPILITTIPFL